MNLLDINLVVRKTGITIILSIGIIVIKYEEIGIRAKKQIITLRIKFIKTTNLNLLNCFLTLQTVEITTNIKINKYKIIS